jgi:micrococcal nuclease
MYEYRAKVIRVVDGDTIAFAVDLGLDVSVNLTVRLIGVNCPEMKGDTRLQGRMAKAFTSDWMGFHGDFIDGERWVSLHTHKDKREKYGRYLGEIYSNSRCLNEDLVAAEHAVRYIP